jgi:hypothetical protein
VSAGRWVVWLVVNLALFVATHVAVVLLAVISNVFMGWGSAVPAGSSPSDLVPSITVSISALMAFFGLLPLAGYLMTLVGLSARSGRLRAWAVIMAAIGGAPVTLILLWRAYAPEVSPSALAGEAEIIALSWLAYGLLVRLPPRPSGQLGLSSLEP